MARSLLEPVARLGFAARGVLYSVIGILAAQAAVGTGGRTTGAEGAVREIDRMDTTGLLLLALAVGLVGYSIWRLAQALFDLDRKGTGPKALAIRAGHGGSGLVYLGMALTAFGFGLSRGPGGTMRTFVARSLSEPWGQWAVGAGGALVVGVGIYQFYKAWSTKFEEHLRTGRMSGDERRWFRRIGRFGLFARGVTFVVIGWFLIRAARFLNAGEVKDLGGALRTLQGHEYGAWLLGIVACGLVSYGLFSFVEARYRKILA